MRLQILISFLVVIKVVSGANNRTNPATNTTTVKPTPDRRIIGGIEAEHNEYPFIVTLSRHGQHFCGGSIINESWIVSAAHCAVHADFTVTAGEHDLRIMEGSEQQVRAVDVIRHPDYNPVTYEDDICLIKVEPPFVFTKYVQAFNVPSSHFIAVGNVTTAGWGVEEEGSHDVSPVLRKVTIGLFPNMECAKQYGGGFKTHKMICAGEEEGGKDACQGDSGGPLLCDHHHYGSTLCGIVSFGFGCARKDFVGVYTKVAHYSDWIMWVQSKAATPAKPPGPGRLTYRPPVTVEKYTNSWTTSSETTTPYPPHPHHKRNTTRSSRPNWRNKNNSSKLSKTSVPFVLGIILSLMIKTP